MKRKVTIGLMFLILELHIIVVVGHNNGIAYSYDSINWKITTPPEVNNFSGFSWSRELGIFVATSIGNNKAIVSSMLKNVYSTLKLEGAYMKKSLSI